MARDEDPTRGKVVASIPRVIRGVSEEDTVSRTGSQLVGSGGGGVRVTRTPKDSKVIVSKRAWCGVGAGQAVEGRR
jgi:hypothetical protein